MLWRKIMRPYCRNNSNFTFREICCGPPIHDECECECECECDNKCSHKHDDCGCIPQRPKCNCDKRPPRPCNCNPKNTCRPNHIPCNKPPHCQHPFLCLPINGNSNCECNPFTFVMIGYMLGKNCCPQDFETDLDCYDN